MPYSDETSEAIATRGEEIYQSLRDELESQYKGKIFVVDIETGNYEIDDEDLEATDRLFAKNPDAVIYGLVCVLALDLSINSALDITVGNLNRGFSLSIRSDCAESHRMCVFSVGSVDASSTRNRSNP